MDPRYEGSIAIIGMAGRMPNAANLQEFWAAQLRGESLIVPLDEATLRARGVAPALLANSAYVRVANNMADIDCFDHQYFGYGAREAAIIDPQQRILLELAHEAFEHAGYVPESLKDKVGVYLGAGYCNYLVSNLSGELDASDQLGGLQYLMGNDKDYAATRVSYKLNLTGPSMAVNSACSTSLVALHQACRALQSFECDLALAGAAKINIPNDVGYLHQEGGISSRDGVCRPYDADGSGPVFGSGAGVVLLKRTEDAVRDRDQIFAVIRGSAINNDGAGKVSYSAPSTDGQIAVIADALADAGVDAADIGYVEGHGTSTSLGDPIEVAALAEYYQSEGVPVANCYLGSVKANVGHLEAAAGMAGLFKTVFALRDNLIPPLLNFRRQNQNIAFEKTPFKINTRTAAWPGGAGAHRLAGLSAFGIGGTNAHVIVEAWLTAAPAASLQGPFLLPLSAKTPQALEALRAAYAEQFSCASLSTEQVAFTAALGRRHHPYRLALTGGDRDELAAALAQPGAIGAPEHTGVAFCGSWEALSEQLAQQHDLVGHGVKRALVAIEASIANSACPPPTPGAARQRFDAAVLQLAYAQWLLTAGAPVNTVESDQAGLPAACLLKRVMTIEQAIGALQVAHRLRPTHAADSWEVDLSRSGIVALGASAAQRYQRLQAPACWSAEPAQHGPTSGMLGPCVAPDAGDRLARYHAGLLRLLGDAYQAGARLDWAAIYRGCALGRTSVPTYPFAKTRCWIDAAAPAAPKAQPVSDSANDAQLCALIARFAMTDAGSVGPDTRFQSELGMESLMLAELNAAITTRFGVCERIPLSLYFNDGKVGDLLAWLQQYQARQGQARPAPLSAVSDVTPEARLTFISGWERASSFPALQRIDRTLVHKTLAANVLVARTERIGGDVFAAEITQDRHHAYHYEHAQDHVPGLYLIEAARQGAIAIAHQHYQVPFGAKFIMNDLASRFVGFAELDAPLFMAVEFAEKAIGAGVLERAVVRTSFVQHGREIGQMESQAVVFAPAAYDSLREGAAIIAGETQ